MLGDLYAEDKGDGPPPTLPQPRRFGMAYSEWLPGRTGLRAGDAGGMCPLLNVRGRRTAVMTRWARPGNRRSGQSKPAFTNTSAAPQLRCADRGGVEGHAAQVGAVGDRC